jgi:hypothetical protein
VWVGKAGGGGEKRESFLGGVLDNGGQ